MIKSNFHTHTVYCDGADAPEELVLQAIQLGFTGLGFSGHAHSRVEDYSMSAENQEKYRRDICALKEKYRDKIEMKKIRFRTLGCWPLTGAIESEADTIEKIVEEMMTTTKSERTTRVIDFDQEASMEQKKREGYF